MSDFNARKKKFVISGAFLNVLIVGIFFAVVTLCLLFIPRETVSQIENRSLAKFPEFSPEMFFSGEYTDEISYFFNDTVPMRDTWKNFSANIQNLKGISFKESGKIYGGLTAVTTAAETAQEPVVIETTAPELTTVPSEAAVTVETTTAEVTTTAPETEKPQNEIADGVVTNGQLVVFMDGHYRGMSLFGGGTGEAYASSLNSFAEDLDGFAKVYSMVIPTSAEYYCPSNYEAYNASQRESIDSINSRFSDKVTAIDAYAVLLPHKDEDIYTRTDHHWEPLGAYYAAEAFANTAETTFSELSSYKEVMINGYIGTLYSYTQSADLLNDPEDFIYYKPQNDYTAYYYTTDYTFEYDYPLFVDQPVSQSYSTFMGGDKKIVRIETDCKNGRKLAVLKDSYGNAEIPFYTNSFEEIYVLDIRYFDLNAIDFIKEQGITDVLFTMCTFSAVGTNANNIEIIRTQGKAE